jgi:hypothetical protein
MASRNHCTSFRFHLLLTGQRSVEVHDGHAGREADPAGERLDALAFAVEEEALEVDAGVPALA